MDGALLLQIDVQLFGEYVNFASTVAPELLPIPYSNFADELGVDSHEIREVFLAKIYELSNPRFSVGGIEDDFRCKMHATSV